MENQFDEIITNPAKFRDDGLLELRRRVDPNGKQHECKVGCSPNMCKGESFWRLSSWAQRKDSSSLDSWKHR